jgi:hypothetical protein
MTEPKIDPTAWANGTWVAVLYDGKPLPYLNSANALQQDSLKLIVTASTIPPKVGVYPFMSIDQPDGVAPPVLDCMEPHGVATISDVALTTRAQNVRTEVGACNADFVTFDLTRKGETLIGVWSGKVVHLVKRP